MAGQSDGSIIIDTELNSEGFKAGSSELKQAIKSLSGSVDRLGPSLQKALRGGEAGIASFDARVAALEDTIAQLELRLESLGSATFETDDYRNISAEIDAVVKKMDQLTARRDRMHELGVSEDSMQYRRLIYDLTELEAKYLQLAQAKAKMEADGTAYQAGSQTAEYQRLNALLVEAKEKLAALKAEAEQSGSSLKGLASDIASGVKSALAGFKGFRESARGLHKPINSLTKSLFRLGPALMMARGMMGVLRQAVSAYMAENEQLANTLSSCWSGLGNLLGPIISRVINLVATAVAYITKFLSLLGFVGASTKKAISGAGGAAEKETEKLHRQLASFDELNILQREEDTSGGGGGAADAELPDVTLPDWVQQIAEQLKAGNWAEAATILTDQLNAMVDSVDWAGVGSKIAYYLDGALTFLATAITSFNWYNLGVGLGELINSVIDGVDWKNLGIVLGGHIIALIGTLGGIFATLDWRGLGKALTDAFMGLWDAIDWAMAGKMLSDGIIGALNMLTEAIKGFNWHQIGSDIGAFLSAIDWGGIFAALGELLWTAFLGMLEGIGELIAGIGPAKIIGALLVAVGAIVAWIEAGAMLAPVIAAIGGALSSLLGTIIAAFVGWPPLLIAAIAAVVGLLILWISENFPQISEAVSTWAAETKAKISEWVSNFKTNMTEWAANVKATVTTWAADTKTKIVTWANETKQKFFDWASQVLAKIKSCFADMLTAISERVSSIKQKVTAGFESAKNSMVEKMRSAVSIIKAIDWHSIGTAICNGIKNGIEAGWTWLKNTVQSVAQRLLAAAKAALGIHSPSRLFRDQVGLNIGYGVGEGIEDSEGSIIGSVRSVAGAIADEFKSNEYSIAPIGTDFDGNLVRTLDNVSDRIANSFADLMDRMQAIANGAHFTTPKITTVVPPHVQYMASASSRYAQTDAFMEDLNSKLEVFMEDVVQSNIAGFETLAAQQREILEAILNIEIGDDVIGKAATRYSRHMNFVKGNSG